MKTISTEDRNTLFEIRRTMTSSQRDLTTLVKQGTELHHRALTEAVMIGLMLSAVARIVGMAGLRGWLLTVGIDLDAKRVALYMRLASRSDEPAKVRSLMELLP